MKVVKNIVEYIEAKKGGEIVSIQMTTSPKTRASGKHLNIKKHTKVSAVIGIDYTSCKNLGLARDGQPADFEAQARRWGDKLNKKHVAHKGKDYLPMWVNRTLSSEYTINGKACTYDDIKGHLYTSKAPTPYREVNYDNISLLRMRGKRLERNPHDGTFLDMEA